MAKLIGTRDDDELEGGGEKDRLEGRGGDDRLVGRGGKDRLIGGAGDDDLDGGDGGDQLEGGGGNDTLRGGDGNDVIDPGSSGGDGDVIIGGKGDDSIDFSAGGDAYTLTYSRLATALKVRLGDATGTVDKGGQGTDSLRGLGAIVSVAGLTVVGGSGDDLIKASLGPGRSESRHRSGRVRLRHSQPDHGRHRCRTSPATSTRKPSAIRSACASASRRTTFRSWCRCGCSRWRSPAATRSC